MDSQTSLERSSGAGRAAPQQDVKVEVVGLSRSLGLGGDLRVIDHMLARGEMVAAQLPSYSCWTPEKKLAAAAFTAALLNIRDHSRSSNRKRRRQALDDLAWVESNDTEWPYSFLRMCEIFDVDPGWVRERVQYWVRHPGAHDGRRFSTHRHAA
jgi:hypothetical protein